MHTKEIVDELFGAIPVVSDQDDVAEEAENFGSSLWGVNVKRNISWTQIIDIMDQAAERGLPLDLQMDGYRQAAFGDLR